jgi:hypothetical protein
MALCLLIGFLARLAPEGLTIPTTVMHLPVLLDLTVVVAPPSLTVLAVEEFMYLTRYQMQQYHQCSDVSAGFDCLVISQV